MESSSRRVVINVGGVRFETYASTLQSLPGTKLANLSETVLSSADDCNPQRYELFFDRNPKVFAYILDYYRTKHLHCSDNMCKSVLMEELRFWEVSRAHLSHCCWLKINSKSRDLEDFISWDETTQSEQQQLLSDTGRVDYSWRARWQPKVWSLFEKPFSSLPSMCVTAISMLFIIGAIVFFFEETKYHFIYVFNHTDLDTYHSFLQELDSGKVLYLFYLEFVCVLWFVSEFCTRLFFCPDKKEFLKSPLNWADFISLFPVFIQLMTKGQEEGMEILWIILGFLRSVYVIKLLRFLLLMEGSLVLKVLSGTLWAISREIFILLIILALETLFFANLAFHAEMFTVEPDHPFGHIYNCC
ncbi:potassium voltage-gated channel subfamily C member 1-like [Pseudophryne corroboree]|uniref:potassium voltage-gated channel subfamily C member 1-like n=1 Tax=Pseudophryne corroboree TaxID=495146 RepID=UPI0030815CFB